MSHNKLITQRSYDLIDNSLPEKDVAKLVPVGLLPIKITALETPRTSFDLLKDAQKYGFREFNLSFKLYGRGKIGTPRRLDNSELIVGYPMYGADAEPTDIRVQRLKVKREEIISATKDLETIESSIDPLLWDEESDDALKFNIQRTRRFGRHLSLPFSNNLLTLNSYPRSFLELLSYVCAYIVKSTDKILPSRSECILSQTDAIETAPGAPLFAPGDEIYHLKRLASLSITPVPTYDKPAHEYLSAVYNMGNQIGLPNSAMTWASYLSFRQGAKRKPQTLWFENGSNFLSTFEAESMESNQRLVFPGAFPLNLLQGPPIYMMKLFRRRKLGMFHTPELQSRYIDSLKKQGNVCYVSDFSNYDMTVSNYLMRYVCKALGNSKFKWEFDLFDAYLRNTGVIYPSYYGSSDPMSVTFLQGPVSLLSGWLGTSELGSIISLAVNLWALSLQIPDIVSQWVSGKFVILIQSDDVLFTLPKAIDEERFTADVAKLHIDTKLKLGTMFLKRMLPLGYLSSQKGQGRPISRIIQNTFGNEESYSDKIDAIIRLGLVARCEGLQFNPAWDKYKPIFTGLLEGIDIFEPIIGNYDEGLGALSSADIAAIQEFSSNEGSAWVTKLLNRADSDPAAAALIAQLSQVGFNFDPLKETLLDQRREYYKALLKIPDNDDFKNFHSFASWAT